ncbi:hypothetical protein ACFQS7_30585, partial [Dankookia sp. GCM10030260]
SRLMATTSKWCSASHRQAAALPRRSAPLAATPQTGKIVQAVVERSIAWLNRCRRLAKDWECLNRSALAFLRWASVRLMLRRLCKVTK